MRTVYKQVRHLTTLPMLLKRLCCVSIACAAPVCLLTLHSKNLRCSLLRFNRLSTMADSDNQRTGPNLIHSNPNMPRSIRARTGATTDPIPHGKKLDAAPQCASPILLRYPVLDV